jgi:hypothetical protein
MQDNDPLKAGKEKYRVIFDGIIWIKSVFFLFFSKCKKGGEILNSGTFLQNDIIGFVWRTGYCQN